MIYSFDEIRNIMAKLRDSSALGSNYQSLDKEVCDQAVDMMDDMLHALEVYEGLCPVLYSRGLLPDTPKDCARFWNRERDKENTRLFE